jgi:hypothetical protein
MLCCASAAEKADDENTTLAESAACEMVERNPVRKSMIIFKRPPQPIPIFEFKICAALF